MKATDTVIFTFGRFSPPTIGHQKLVDKVLEESRSTGSDHCVFISQTRNKTTDPLEWSFKVRVFEAAFPGIKVSKNTDIKTPFNALKALSEQYSNAIMVVGSDQLKEFETRMESYSKEWGINLSVVSAGKRIAESSGVTGISATKMRQYALNEQKEEFFDNLPSTLSTGIKNLVYLNTQRGLK